MLTLALCFCLALVGSAQIYSPGMSSSYGYPGAYGNQMSNNYMGAYSPYGSPYGMSGYAGNMNHLYGQNMMYGGMNGMSGMGSYGYPYNRINSAATNKPFLPIAGPMQPVRSQSFAYLGNSDGNFNPNC